MNKVVWCNRGWMPYHYGFCPNAKAWDREMKLMMIDPPPPYPAEFDGRCVHFENTADNNACSIVTLKPGDKSAVAKIGMLTHEAVHVWQAMRETIGEDEPSDEFEAYSIQNIAQELILAFEKARGPLCLKRCAD